jgi:hypothetical protein
VDAGPATGAPWDVCEWRNCRRWRGSPFAWEPAPVIDLSYARTDLLNLTGIADGVITANNQFFAYSPGNKLSSASGAYGSLSWTYDGVGNRTQEISTPIGGSATTRVLTYPGSSNRLSTVTIGAATERDFTYDAAGNITTDTRSGTLYAYGTNARNRLETVTVAGSLRGSYTYNALEQLASRVLTNITPAGTTHFVHDRLGVLPEASTFKRHRRDRPLAVADAALSSRTTAQRRDYCAASRANCSSARRA